MAPPPNYKLVYSDEFSSLSIADTTTATANWYSGQAWGGSFGDAKFMKAGSERSPFAIVDKGGESALQITMSRNASGQLESGLISNTFPDGTSKTPQDGNPYGYYETRLWLPEGQGVWPAFWSIEKERLSPTRDHVVEVDVLEQHGNDLADRFSSNLHDWNWNGTILEDHSAKPMQNVIGTGILTSGWHVYGVEIRPETTTYYMDGKAYYSVATPATLDTDPMFMINLAAGGGWKVDPSLNNAKMYVDYFRAYELTDAQPAKFSGITLTGKGGDDTFIVDASDTRIVESANGGFDTVRSKVDYTLPDNVEKLYLYEGNAKLATGNAGDNQLFGNAGDNTLSGLDGNDYLYGRDGNDLLVGGAGNDKLYGENGNDRLYGGMGADRLEGGAGADTFIFKSVAESTPTSRDTIVDFNGAQGDRIDLSEIDANILVAGHQSFNWIGAQPFKNAGDLRLEKGVLSGDVNGDHIADFAVFVGSTALTKDYFLL